MSRHKAHPQFPGQDELDRIVARAEEILGYAFRDKSLLIRALTHPSVLVEQRVELSYERLEFVGDAFLGSVIAIEVYWRFPDLDEGSLTRLKNSVVSGESLSTLAAELGFADVIIFGESERGTGCRGMHSALENVFESVVAALLLDGGAGVAKSWIMRTVAPRIDGSRLSCSTNYKGRLQEVLQRDGKNPEYRIVEEEGPPHDRTFFAEALCDGRVMGSGSGRSKKEAETLAAQSALMALGEEPKG